MSEEETDMKYSSRVLSSPCHGIVAFQDSGIVSEAVEICSWFVPDMLV